MKTTALRLRIWLLTLAMGSAALAQRMPQDNWYEVKTFGTNASDQVNGSMGMALDRSNRLFVADSGNHRIQVFDRDGNLLYRWGSQGSGAGQFNYPRAICITTNDLVYVADQNNNRVQVFDLQGAFLAQWPISQPTAMSFAPVTGEIHVADNQNKQVKVYACDTNGTVLRSWGTGGSLPGQLSDILGIAVDATPDGLIYLLDYDPAGNNTLYPGHGIFRVQLFGVNGEFQRMKSLNNGQTWNVSYASGPFMMHDGRCAVFQSHNGEYGGGYNNLWLFGRDLSSPTSVSLSLYLGFTAYAEAADGLMYQAKTARFGSPGIRMQRRAFRTIQDTPVPQPLLLRTSQRLGTTFVDVDYRIVSSSISNVTVAALALADGVISLSKVILMKTFAEGTSTNLGPGLPANQSLHLTWNAGADWSTNFGNLKICLLANDGRAMLDHLLLSIPANGTNAALTISRDPVTEAELLNCWLWLLANGDPALTLTNGQVKSNATVLASGTTTTATGRAFLFNRMGLREATAQELAYMREAGTPGVVTQWAPRFTVGPNIHPRSVNAWGFDAASWGSTAWWVVKP